MPEKINLKGGFDAELREAGDALAKLAGRLTMERARPAVWARAQIEDLVLFHQAIAQLLTAVSEFANRARDD